jgi:zinc protease
VNKRVTLALVLLLSFLSVDNERANALNRHQNAGPQASPFVLPIVKRDSLLNGLQLITIEQPGTGAVRAHLRINSGAMFDLANKGGLAHITAGMLLRGGGGWSAKNISDSVEQLGLTININVGWDSTDIVISGPANTLNTIIDLMSKLVISPAFDQKEFDSLKSQRVAQLKADQSDDTDVVRRKAVETVFGAHPYGRPVHGTAESIAQLTRADLSYYHNRFYLANNSELIITGDAAAVEITRLARMRLGAWKKGEKVPATFRPPDQATARRVVVLDRPQSDTARVAIAQIGFSRRAEDYFAAAVMADLLGQMSAKISAAFPGAVVETRAEPRLLPGLLLIEVKAPAGDATSVVNAVVDAMTRMQTAQLSVEEVEAAKARLIASMAERLRTTEGAAGVILDIELYGLGRDYLINYADRVNKISPADLQRAAAAYLKPQSVVAVIAAPAAKSEEPLKKIGTVTVVK